MLPVSEWLEIDQYALYLTEKLQIGVLADYDRYEFHVAVQKIVSFCSEDLGGFYLDILKDRLYTAGENSHARRAAQSALHHITHTFMRLIAPILSFTANEIWESLGLNKGADANKTVFEDFWYVLPKHGLSAQAILSWEDVIQVRAQVNKKIEEKRAEGLVGSSLQSEIDIYAQAELYESLNRLKDDLRFVLITSRATLHQSQDAGLVVEVTPSSSAKCSRCWHYRADVGSHKEHPGICGRCVSNLFGAGEVRKYA